MGSKELSPALQQWLEGHALSHPLRSLRLGLSNGYLVAELLSKYYPADVSMIAFGNYGSMEKKKTNWWLLMRLFKKGKIPIKERLVKSVINAEEGAAVKLLTILHAYLEGPGEGAQAAEEASEAMATPSESIGAVPQNPGAQHQPLTWTVPGQAAGSAGTAPQAQAQAQSQAAAAAVVAEAAHPRPPEEGSAVARQQQSSVAVSFAAAGTAAAGSPPLIAAGHHLGDPASPAVCGAGYPAVQPEQQLAYADVASAGIGPAMYALQSAASLDWGVVPGTASLPAPTQEPQLLSYYSSAGTSTAYHGGMYEGQQFMQEAYSGAPPGLVQPADATLYGYGWEGWQPPYVSESQNTTALLPGTVPALHKGGPHLTVAVERAGGRTWRGAASSQPPNQQQQRRRQQQRPDPARLPPLGDLAGGQPSTSMLPLPVAQASAGADCSAARAAAASPPEVGSSPAAEPQPRIEYDKRPRPVTWVPHSYKDYQLREYDIKQAKAYWELGKLGTDCYDTAKWREKWEKLERQKAFGQAARAVNLQKTTEHPGVPAPKKKPPSSREKALEFAMSLHRPEPSRSPSAQLVKVGAQLCRAGVQLRELATEEKEGLASLIRTELARTALQGQGAS